jgi:very-short-patch-repair endonuclease
MAYLTAKARTRARQLRKNEVSAEQRLWEALRNRRLGGFKFVRQFPLGPYFADFACRAHKLVIEVDGATHASDEAIRHDARRAEFLAAEGYRVLRFHNDDIDRHLDDVRGAIIAALNETG